jgi:hypothetical protein
VAVDLVPLAGQTPAGPAGDLVGKTAPHKLDEIIQQEVSLPG